MVIDANGSWVGPTASVQWASIQGMPTDIADGDDDTLTQLSCLAGEIVGWTGTAWSCVADNGLTEAEVEHYITNAPIDLATGSMMGGMDLVTVDADQDSLGSLSCMAGDVAKWDAVLGSWVCATDDNEQDWNTLQGIPSDLADGDNDVLGGLNCMAGQVAHFDGAMWSCLDVASLFDMDGDGLSLWDDCDDADPIQRAKR